MPDELHGKDIREQIECVEVVADEAYRAARLASAIDMKRTVRSGQIRKARRRIGVAAKWNEPSLSEYAI
jgi:hypothetical protein